MTLIAQKAPAKWLVVGIQLKIEISRDFKHRPAINSSSTSKCLIGGKENRKCPTPGAVRTQLVEADGSNKQLVLRVRYIPGGSAGQGELW